MVMYATDQIYVKPDKRSLENFIQKSKWKRKYDSLTHWHISSTIAGMGK